MPGPARGNVAIDVEECKGCGLCVESHIVISPVSSE